MVKIDLGRNFTGQTPRSKGSFLVRDNKGRFTAQKWPEPRGQAKTPYDFYRQQEFMLAGRMASSAISEDIFTAWEMTKGTQQVPRDFLTMCIFGNGYELQDEDGFIWPTFRSMAPNPQYMLDLITTTVGSITYRADIGWIGLDPGNAGQVLMMENGLPRWRDPAGGGGIAPKISTLKRTTNQALVSANNWKCIFQAAEIDELNIWDPTNPTRLYIPPTATKIRLSSSVMFAGSSVNQTSTTQTPDNTGSLTWLGALRNQLTRNTTSGIDKYMTSIGPWVQNPGIDWCELQWSQSNTQNDNFKANTTFTLEAVF